MVEVVRVEVEVIVLTGVLVFSRTENPILCRWFDTYADVTISNLADEVVYDVEAIELGRQFGWEQFDTGVGFAVERVVTFDDSILVRILEVPSVNARDALDTEVGQRLIAKQ
ncbi:hypothetical protein G3I44_19985 [Halogeometricum borinquense]|uniref:Uncharacterized protein n=1 Tax=Halogeometricum borinquense TaxID=60847 RepID=A0A6C0UM67_9EURY|nr:hypothetical protein [Halogeometricum borinquense]QIB76337.1 hypothetical protein G3I44_19985 [Halogeometricum borinquense]